MAEIFFPQPNFWASGTGAASPRLCSTLSLSLPRLELNKVSLLAPRATRDVRNVVTQALLSLTDINEKFLAFYRSCFFLLIVSIVFVSIYNRSLLLNGQWARTVASVVPLTTLICIPYIYSWGTLNASLWEHRNPLEYPPFFFFFFSFSVSPVSDNATESARLHLLGLKIVNETKVFELWSTAAYTRILGVGDGGSFLSSFFFPFLFFQNRHSLLWGISEQLLVLYKPEVRLRKLAMTSDKVVWT